MKTIKRGSKGSNAQVSIEYILILGFVSFVVLSILGVAIYYTGNIKDRIKSNYINNYGNKIVSTSEYIFYSGEPSKATITCYLPESVEDVYVNANSLVITYSTSSGKNIRSFDSNVPIVENLSSDLTVSPGLKRIEITARSNNAIIRQIH
jgi:hypothetical protein